jgi:hypothetical protein
MMWRTNLWATCIYGALALIAFATWFCEKDLSVELSSTTFSWFHIMMPSEYTGMYGVPSGMQPGISGTLDSLHPFFSQARVPEAPLTEDDLALFMLLVTYSDALDALPMETTRIFSDLRELDAVLGGA